MKQFKCFRVITLGVIAALLMVILQSPRLYADTVENTETVHTISAEGTEADAETSEITETETAAAATEMPETETTSATEVPESETTDTTEVTESETTDVTEIPETETTSTTEATESETTEATEEPTVINLSSCKISLSYTSCTYNGSARKPTPTVTLTVNGSTVTLKKNTDYTVSYSNNTKVGTGKVTITGIGSYTGSASASFTIKAKSISKATVTLSTTSYTYNGTARKPTPTVTLTLNSKTVTLKKNTDYTVSYSSNTKAGTAKVTIKGKGNYSGSVSKTFTIKAKSLSKATVTLSTTSYTYNGTARKPSTTVKLTVNGKTVTLKKNTDYTVTYSNNTKAGTAKVTIKGKGNYSGSVSKTFTIKKKSLSKATVKLSKTSYTYNGEAKKPSVTVKLTVNGKTVTLKKNTDYTVTYSSNTKVGTAKVTIKGKGNYSGSVSKTYTIKPKATSISKYTVSGNTISLTLKKISTQATGYQVQYATNSTFTKNKTTKTISSYKTLTKKLTSLKYKTTYYVRVRTYKTVDGKKYYSAWSTVKKIKTGSKGEFKTTSGLTYYYVDGVKTKSQFLTVSGKTYYFDSDGVMMKGWMQSGSDYYYLDRETGVMQTSCTVNGVTLDKNGKAKQTEYSVSKIEVMIKARTVMNEITEPTDSKETKLRKCFDWVMSHSYYQYRKLRVARVDYPDTWMMVFANDMFDTGKGCCVSEASSFSFLATECGYTAYIADDTGHAWTEINGLVYDTLFAEVYGYTDYYGASYSAAGFWRVNKTLI